MLTKSQGHKRKFLDAHVHLWQLASKPWYPTVRRPEAGEDPLGDLSNLKLDFAVEDYIRSVEDVDLIGCVQISAAQGQHWTDEDMWLEGARCRTELPSAIVATLDMAQGSPFESCLRERLAAPALRGVRVSGLDFRSEEAKVLMDVLADRGLVFGIGAAFGGGNELWPEIADKYPRMQFVLENTGRPRLEERADWDGWAASILPLAQRPNIACKLSGLGMTFHATDAEVFARYWRHCIEHFGSDRCMFASNYPIDLVYGSFASLLKSFETATADLSSSQQDDLFWKSAARTFRIDLAGSDADNGARQDGAPGAQYVPSARADAS